MLGRQRFAAYSLNMGELDEQQKDIIGEVEDQPSPGLMLELSPTRLSIGPTRMLLNWRLDVTNGGASHIIALRIWSDMVSAHSSVPSREQLGGPDMADARLHKVAQMTPGAQDSIAGEWQMPRNAVKLVDNSPDQLILPLARLRCIGAGIAPTKKAFVIGLPPAPGEEILRAIQLNGDMQIHSRVSAKAVT